MLERFNPSAGFLDFGFRPLLAANEGGEFAAPLFHDLREFMDSLLEGLPLLPERSAHLLFRRQRHPAFGQTGVGRVALLARGFHLRGQFFKFQLAGLLAGFAFAGRGGQPCALLQAFLFLGGQALNLIDHRVNLLEEQPLRALQGVEFAFVGGDGHLLGAQVGLRLLKAGLELGLLALEGALGAAEFRHLLVQRGEIGPQPGNLVFPPQDGSRGLAIAVAVVTAARVNAVAAQQLAAQCDVMEGAVALVPSGSGRVEIPHDAGRAQQALQQGLNGRLALHDRQRLERDAVEFGNRGRK